jgi:hypothetical protein
MQIDTPFGKVPISDSKSFCHICLKEGKTKRFGELDLCSECMKMVKTEEAKGIRHKPEPM